MKFSGIATEILIDPRKLTLYALNARSRVGKHKAFVFEKVLGITRGDSSFLLRQIEEKAPLFDWHFQKEDKWGKRYTVDIMVEGINGATAKVRTGWIVDRQRGPARMTTIFILERGR